MKSTDITAKELKLSRMEPLLKGQLCFPATVLLAALAGWPLAARAQSGPQERGQLEAERLAAAGGQQREHIASGQGVADDFALEWAKGSEAEEFLQRPEQQTVVRVHWLRAFHANWRFMGGMMVQSPRGGKVSRREKARVFHNRHGLAWVEQATRLCRSATRRPEPGMTEGSHGAARLPKLAFELPQGQWPGGTGESPVPPMNFN